MKNLTVVTFLVLSTLAPVGVHAEDLSVHFVILESEGEGPVVRGTMRVEVHNTGLDPIHAVELRLAETGSNLVEEEPLELGTVAANEAATVTARFVLEEVGLSEGNLLWRVDYEDVVREAKRVYVAGIRDES